MNIYIVFFSNDSDTLITYLKGQAGQSALLPDWTRTKKKPFWERIDGFISNSV